MGRTTSCRPANSHTVAENVESAQTAASTAVSMALPAQHGFFAREKGGGGVL
jgi:hypothetical protein